MIFARLGEPGQPTLEVLPTYCQATGGALGRISFTHGETMLAKGPSGCTGASEGNDTVGIVLEGLFADRGVLACKSRPYGSSWGRSGAVRIMSEGGTAGRLRLRSTPPELLQ